MAVPKLHAIKPPARRLLSSLVDPPPHLDMRGKKLDEANEIISSTKPQLDPDVPEGNTDVDMLEIYDRSKADSRAQVEKAAARSQPDQRLPAFTGLSHMDFYPMHYTDGENQLDTAASVGRTNLFDGLREFNGNARTEEIARNMPDRNRGNKGSLMPAIHPRGGEEHFGRDIFVVRSNNADPGNGRMYMGDDVIELPKGHDDAATVIHELNHGRSHWSPYRQPMLDSGSGISSSPRAWLRHALNDNVGKFGGINHEIFREAKRLGQMDKLDTMTMNVPFLGRTGGMDLMQNHGASRYAYIPQEINANIASFKDMALQLHGFDTLAAAGDEMAFMRHALSQGALESTPPGLPSTWKHTDYNQLLLSLNAIRKSLTAKGQQGFGRAFVKAGAAAAPVMAAGTGEDQ